MDWAVQVGDACFETLIWLAPMAVVFGVLTRWMPCNAGMFWWKNWEAASTDILYWFAMPVLLRSLRAWIFSIGITHLFQGATPGFAIVRDLPLGLQCVIILVLQDVMLYWLHRGFHSKWAWSFHAVHHSPTTLDWFSSARFHLVNHVFSFLIVDLVVLFLGFRMEAMLVLFPFNLVYSSMVHANLNWTFGPFRYVFASPVFHRWHHVAEGEGVDKNFASTFPILDLAFGTYYMPAGELPKHFGNGDTEFPEDFWGQWVYPFLAKKSVPTTNVSAPVPPAGRQAA